MLSVFSFNYKTDGWTRAVDPVWEALLLLLGGMLLLVEQYLGSATQKDKLSNNFFSRHHHLFELVSSLVAVNPMMTAVSNTILYLPSYTFLLLTNL
jgi:hypothetical protein